MNSKYVSSTPVLNIGALLFVFIVFDTGKGQFDVANLVITTAVVEAILAV